jgi:hypothetical protein
VTPAETRRQLEADRERLRPLWPTHRQLCELARIRERHGEHVRASAGVKRRVVVKGHAFQVATVVVTIELRPVPIVLEP